MKMFIMACILLVGLTTSQESVTKLGIKEFELALPEKTRVARPGYVMCGGFFATDEGNVMLYSRMKIPGSLFPSEIVMVPRRTIITVIDNEKPIPTLTLVGPPAPAVEFQSAANASVYIIKISIPDFLEARPCLPNPLPTVKG